VYFAKETFLHQSWVSKQSLLLLKVLICRTELAPVKTIAFFNNSFSIGRWTMGRCQGCRFPILKTNRDWRLISMLPVPVVEIHLLVISENE